MRSLIKIIILLFLLITAVVSYAQNNPQPASQRTEPSSSAGVLGEVFKKEEKFKEKQYREKKKSRSAKDTIKIIKPEESPGEVPDDRQGGLPLEKEDLPSGSRND